MNDSHTLSFNVLWTWCYLVSDRLLGSCMLFQLSSSTVPWTWFPGLHDS